LTAAAWLERLEFVDVFARELLGDVSPDAGLSVWITAREAKALGEFVRAMRRRIVPLDDAPGEP
jgi:hypothetical protein